MKRIAALDAELADNRQALDSAVNAQIRTQITDRTIGTAFRDGWLPPPDRQPGRRAARETSARSREPVFIQWWSGLLAARHNNRSGAPSRRQRNLRFRRPPVSKVIGV